MDRMMAEADKGAPLMLVDGRGRVWREWVINRIESVESVFLENGAPREIEFRLELTRYGEDG
jgi:hypothetical protein